MNVNKLYDYMKWYTTVLQRELSSLNNPTIAMLRVGNYKAAVSCMAQCNGPCFNPVTITENTTLVPYHLIQSSATH